MISLKSVDLYSADVRKGLTFKCIPSAFLVFYTKCFWLLTILIRTGLSRHHLDSDS
ncbi:hypothetical protein P691DRAFT_803439 [Macrolepiota fuliginosa MF-IS2]|uniref:Uncharacterized protein n=1 Tax=Macrolepiota fuliginosa MF-IS2 TaxID=1400762 RepID=A0A9P5XJU5_9AGAR|nr:hypothetical protein P691DRAFT_803439 [Macrolepiota fuliginosa MF-IS2]